MRLPLYLTSLSPVGETLRSVEGEISRLGEDVSARNAQLSVSSATDGLSLWEKDYSLPAQGDFAARQARIRSVLTGSGTLTKTTLEQLAVTVGGAVSGDVVEVFDTYHITLYALYESDLPEHLPSLEEAVARLKPAHLSVDIIPALLAQGRIDQYTALTGKAHLLLHGHAES